MHMVSEDQIGAVIKRGLRHGALVIGDDPRHEMHTPAQRQDDRVGPFLGRVHIADQIGQILLVRRGYDPRWHPRLIVDGLKARRRAHRRHARRVGAGRIALM